jgi:hypothetical protein
MEDTQTRRVFTVMNDRAQSGSALKPGEIQFMQNRRIPAIDYRGMGEYLNELNDRTQKGTRVPATYYLEVSESMQSSKQRLVQHKVDDAAQVFFNFNMTSSGQAGQASTLSADLIKCGITDKTKFVSLPLSRNSILMRVENIADSTNQTVNVLAMAAVLWQAANPTNPAPIVPFMLVQEMSLTANMPLTELEERRIHWKTVDDATRPPSSRQPVSDMSQVDFKPMDIKVFQITYTVEGAIKFLN